MQHDITLQTDVRTAGEPKELLRCIAKKIKVETSEINDYRIWKRSVDARGKRVKVNLSVKVATGIDTHIPDLFLGKEYQSLRPDAPTMIIVGAGPAGLFAALKCIECGIRPIVLERGHDVETRRRDIADISRKGRVFPESNYCFGEGGAGAFSDGKLYTRSRKRGVNEEVLQILVQFGANRDILVDAHPHIGSDRLPEIIRNIRETINSCGGKVLFSTKATELLFEDHEAVGVVDSEGKEYRGAVMLAVGHSARDFIKKIHSQGVKMEAKGIAVGVRLEHPQQLIDSIQYHNPKGRGKYLPPAEYSFVTQSGGRGVYSFCMCPGGVIVPAGSGEEELVVNGMSASARAGEKSNSGMVVEIHPEDFPEYSDKGELALMTFQELLENKFFKLSNNSINAPAQRMVDFVNGKKSTSLPSTSYAPGIHSADFSELLPPFISERLKDGFREFGRKRRGFLTNDAILVGLESRTSSPVRIPRDRQTYEHVEIRNLYPVGEGAGYAGGIVSAAIDGMNAVKAYKFRLENKI